MRVGIDARPLCWPTDGGIQRICVNLIPRLKELMPQVEWEIMIDGNIPAGRDPGLPSHRLYGSTMRILTLELPRCVRQRNYDAVLALSPQVLPLTVPVLQVVYDVYPLQYPRLLPRRLMMQPRYWAMIAGAAARMMVLRRLAGAVAISEDTARQVRAKVHNSNTRVSVAYPGVTSSVATTDQESPSSLRSLVNRPYFLYVGAINIHKNIGTLIEAFHRVREQQHRDVTLLLVGHQNWPHVEAFERISADSNIHVLGPRLDAELAFLYRHCIAFVCLSRYEGFGLPVLEAMSCGAPVVVSNRGALPEVVGPAGLLVDPCSPSEVAAALQAICDPRENSRRRHLSTMRSRQFSWDTMASRVADELILLAEMR